MSAQNLTLLTDLYELTMMQGYFETQENQTVVFDVFFRDNPNKGGYSVMAGLDQVIDYIKNLNFSYEDVDYLRGLGLFSEDFLHYLSGFHFSGDIYAIPEGSVIFPREPLLKVAAPIMEAQLVETAILTILNHQCLIATKASRVVYAAQGDGIMEFGLRRAQGPDAGLYGSSCSVQSRIRSLGAAKSEFHDTVSLCRINNTGSFRSDQALMIQNRKNCCLNKLSLHDRSYDFQKRFSWEDDASLRDRINVSAKMKSAQIMKKILTEQSEPS